jgi:hypothetical protein
MPKSRSSQVSLIDTPLLPLRITLCYTCLFMWYGSRATDKYSGTSYEHRRAWVEVKVLWLSSVFVIGICAYAVMSNHVHLVLCVDKDKAITKEDTHFLKVAKQPLCPNL